MITIDEWLPDEEDEYAANPADCKGKQMRVRLWIGPAANDLTNPNTFDELWQTSFATAIKRAKLPIAASKICWQWSYAKAYGSTRIEVTDWGGLAQNKREKFLGTIKEVFHHTWDKALTLAKRADKKARQARRGVKPVILSYGMGVDSTAILVRWLRDQRSRDFALKDLIVLTAQVGNEFTDTYRLVEKHVLPLLRKHKVRYVQIARAGIRVPRGQPNYVVLNDSHHPRLYLKGGGVSLGQEMAEAGTVPQWRSGSRQCSVKWKGQPLDDWIAQETGRQRFRHVMGFNADEVMRIRRDDSYSTQLRESEYPLLEWGWGRKSCEAYLKQVFGEPWQKSCCVFCPFTSTKAGLQPHLQRWDDHPYQCTQALLLERVSASLNPVQTLYPPSGQTKDKGYITGRSAEQVVREAKLDNCLTEFDQRLKEIDWAVYHVQRAWKPGGVPPAKRKVQVVYKDSRASSNKQFSALAKKLHKAIQKDGPYRRIWIKQRPASGRGREELYALAPALALDKSTPGFDQWWREVG